MKYYNYFISLFYRKRRMRKRVRKMIHLSLQRDLILTKAVRRTVKKATGKKKKMMDQVSCVI